MMKGVWSSFAFVAMSTAGLAANLTIEKTDGASGNTEISIVNRGDAVVSISGATINRSSDPACQLLAWQTSLGPTLTRSDFQDVVAAGIAEDYEWVPTIDLPFGGELNGVIFRGCGRVLQIDVWYADETGETFTFDR